MSNYPLIFLHLPKTAGTSLRGIIEKNYKKEELFFVYNRHPLYHTIDELRDFGEEDFKNYKIIMGHFPFNRKLFPFSDRRFVTLIREPVTRCISYYHHVMSREEWRDRQISLKEYMEATDELQFYNHQTRLLAGMRRFPITEKHLENAIRNLETYFLHVGTTNQFPHSIKCLADLLNWRKKKILWENVTSNGSAAVCDLPEDVLQMLRERNEYDARLYDYVTNNLEQL